MPINSAEANAMSFAALFRQGARAAIPIWIAFIPSSFALGVAAKAHGLHWGEIVLMSALVYAGPAQFAAVGPLGAGSPALEILLATLLINLRLIPMSAALAPYFRGAKRATLLLASHFISASSFILPIVRFQREERNARPEAAASSEAKLSFFLGVGSTSYCVWVAGTALGYWAALHVPREFEEGMKFILPSYFACLMAAEVRERAAIWICVVSFFVALPGGLWNPNWGWIVTALVVSTLGWELGRWTRRA
jgi:predicted branched-subunit amino acid permease